MTDVKRVQGPETQLIHAGQKTDPATGAVAVPIYQTTAYSFRDTEHAQNLFALKELGNIYSRIMNPTNDAFEQRIAALEDGVAAVGVASGMSAITLAILNIASAGDEIITDSNLYGGTYNLFSRTLPKYGINVIFVDGKDPENFRQAITEKTKAIFAETITNPSLNIFDIEAVSDIAHENGIPLIIDNTFATPYGAKPITFGADIVIHSATKWIGGHGTSIGGVVVDGGRFNWDQEKFPGFTEPDPSYHGIRFGKDIGPPAFAIKLRVQLLRDIGPALSPQNAFNFLQGLETLNLRLKRYQENTTRVVDYLVNHPEVEWVNYPGLESHPSHELAKKYLIDDFFGSVVTFGIKGDRETGRKVIDNVELFYHVANVGDAKSLIIHPASTTHQQLSAEELEKAGVNEQLIRISVGLETFDDIIHDLDQAIAKATGEEASLKPSTDDAVYWALHSPFAREDGLRKKEIAVVGDPTKHRCLTKLEKLGFYYADYADQEVIDILFVTEPDKIDSLPKHATIIWFRTNDDYQALKDEALENGQYVVENQCLFGAANRIRLNPKHD